MQRVCKSCKWWHRQYEDRWGEFTDDPQFIIPNKPTEYGECKKVVSRYRRGEEQKLADLRKSKTPMIGADIETYSGSWLYTHEDFRCKAWMGKQEGIKSTGRQKKSRVKSTEQQKP